MVHAARAGGRAIPELWPLAAARLGASHARALVTEFQARPPAAVERNGRRPAAVATDADPEAGP
jgi:hypothetical protein